MDVIVEQVRRRARTVLGLLCLIQFFVALDALVVIPLSAEVVLSMGVSPAQAGYLNSSYALAAALASVLFRPAATPGGMQRVLCLALVGLGAVTVGFAFAPGFAALLGMRGLAGGCAGVVMALNLNLLMALLPLEQRKQAVALVMGMFPLALTLGVPALLQLSGDAGWPRVFIWLGSGILVTSTLAMLRPLKPESCSDLAAERTTEQAAGAQATKGAGQEAASEPPSVWGLARPLLAVFLAVFSTFLIVTQYPVYLVAGLQVPTASLSWAYIIGGAGCFLAFQAYGRWHHRVRKQRLIAGLSAGMVLAVLAGFHTQLSQQALFGLIVFMILSATRTTVVVAEVTCALSDALRARFIGFQNALQHLGSGAAGIAGAALVSVTDSVTGSVSDSGALSYQVLLWTAALLIMCVPLIKVSR
ncbi:MFS transporter [Photobacterium sp. MCCC 1A19761]|uniref:MFS transporter n=1 Tax=Photobacterium sp. MCCC 1A19761 TaxID=3115000 RepID=UPI00307F04FD